MGYELTTDNLHLPLYQENDRPSYLGDWNETMRKLDTGYAEVETIASNVSALETTVQGIQTNKADKTQVAALETRVDGNESSITALGASVTALEKSTSNAWKSWSGKKCIIIGDSFSDETSGQKWPTYLSQMLGFTYYNYAVGSTGFLDPGSSGQNMPFNSQVLKAATEHSADKADIDYVFVFGGYNDVSNKPGASQMQDAATQVCVSIQTNFPNAEIVFIPMNWRVDKFTATARNYAAALKYGATDITVTTPVHIIDEVWMWLLCSPSYYGSDNLHPNANGYKSLARYFAAWLTGGDLRRDAMEMFTFNAQNCSYYYTDSEMPFLHGDQIIIPPFYVEIGTQFTGNTSVGTIPDIMRPGQTMYGACYRNNQVAGNWAITSSGKVYLAPTSEVDGLYCEGMTYQPYSVCTN